MSRIGNLSSRIFVGGLDPTVDEVDLEKAFKIFGEIINVMVLRDRENGRSRGFAFISFKDSQSSEQAISRMHGVEIRGRCVSVRHAERERHIEEKSTDSSGDRVSGGTTTFTTTRLPSHGRGVTSFSRGGRYRQSDRVFVTDDEERMEKPTPAYSRHSRSPLIERRHYDHNPPRRIHAASPVDYSPGRTGTFQSGEEQDFGNLDDYRRGSERDYFERPSDRTIFRHEELSPTRELNAYINSRGRSYSPMLQLTKKINVDGTLVSHERDDGFDESPVRSGTTRNEYRSQRNYLDESQLDSREEYHAIPSKGSKSQRGVYENTKTNSRREYRSRSPLSRSARVSERSPLPTSRFNDTSRSNWRKQTSARSPPGHDSLHGRRNIHRSPPNNEIRGSSWVARGRGGGFQNFRLKHNQWNRRGQQDDSQSSTNTDRVSRDDHTLLPRSRMQRGGWSRDNTYSGKGQRSRNNENMGSSHRITYKPPIMHDNWDKRETQTKRARSPRRCEDSNSNVKSNASFDQRRFSRERASSSKNHGSRYSEPQRTRLSGRPRGVGNRQQQAQYEQDSGGLYPSRTNRPFNAGSITRGQYRSAHDRSPPRGSQNASRNY